VRDRLVGGVMSTRVPRFDEDVFVPLCQAQWPLVAVGVRPLTVRQHLTLTDNLGPGVAAEGDSRSRSYRPIACRRF
jgi:hypothetical protein